jgi:hypothetical protein
MSEIQIPLQKLQKNHSEEVSDIHGKLWFKRKLFGWGWTPCSWEGWSILLIYLVYFAIKFTFWTEYLQLLETGSGAVGLTNSYLFILDFLTVSFFFILICYTRGEKPKWQWGKRRD